MNTTRKALPGVELERIEDALVDSILQSEGQEIREELEAVGEDPDALIAVINDATAAAQSDAARKRLERAQSEISQWRKNQANVLSLDREKAMKLLEQARSGDSALNEKMMIAARKGEGLSDSDLEGLLEDLAELDEMEGDDE